jgi:hypothetical protein
VRNNLSRGTADFSSSQLPTGAEERRVRVPVAVAHHPGGSRERKGRRLRLGSPPAARHAHARSGHATRYAVLPSRVHAPVSVSGRVRCSVRTWRRRGPVLTDSRRGCPRRIFLGRTSHVTNAPVARSSDPGVQHL